MDHTSGVDYKQQANSNKSKKWSNVKKSLLLFIVCLLLVLFGFGIYRIVSALDNKSSKIIQDFENARAIKVQLISKRGALAGSMEEYTAYIITRRDEHGRLDVDGRVSFVNKIENQRNNYTLVDDMGYFSIEDLSDNNKIIYAGCLDPSQLPPLYTLEDSLKNARVIDEADGVSCDVGTLIEMMFAGEPYVFCAKDDDVLHSIVGEDVDAVLDYLDEKTDFEMIQQDLRPPAQFDGKPLNCKRKVKENSPSRKLTQIHSVFASMTNKRRLSSLSGRCGCKSKPRPCLFLHGASNKGDGQWTDESDKFGKIANHAPCCSTIKFMNMDTYNYAWTHPKPHAEMCSAALTLSQNEFGHLGNTIGDIIIVTHSMGNLILANALSKNICKLSASTTWVALAGPMEGSYSASQLDEYCTNKGIPEWLLSLVGYCPTSPGHASIMYQNSEFSNPVLDHEYDMAKNVYRKYASAVMCGTSPYGLNSWLSVGLEIISKLSNHKSADDGIVEINSCKANLPHAFQKTYHAKFYEAELGHFGR